MAPAIDNPIPPLRQAAERRTFAFLALARFAVSTLLISFGLSLLCRPWLGMPWWLIVRRCVSVAAAISLWLCIRTFEGRSFHAYGLSWGREGKRHFLFGILLGSAALGAILALGLISGAYRIDVVQDRFRLWRTLIGFIPAAVLVSVLEELVFRGFILQHLLAWHKLAAILLTSALYAVVHLKSSTTFSTIPWLELSGLFLLGCVLAFSYLQTGSLAMSIGLHAALAYGTRVNKLLFGFPNSYSSISWFMGTSRLVNGVISWVVLLGVGILVMWWARWSRRKEEVSQ